MFRPIETDFLTFLLQIQCSRSWVFRGIPQNVHQRGALLLAIQQEVRLLPTISALLMMTMPVRMPQELPFVHIAAVIFIWHASVIPNVQNFQPTGVGDEYRL